MVAQASDRCNLVVFGPLWSSCALWIHEPDPHRRAFLLPLHNTDEALRQCQSPPSYKQYVATSVQTVRQCDSKTTVWCTIELPTPPDFIRTWISEPLLVWCLLSATTFYSISGFYSKPYQFLAGPVCLTKLPICICGWIMTTALQRPSIYSRPSVY